MVANNANKFAVIFLSEIFLERSLGPISTAGTVIVLVFAYFYSRANKPRDPDAPFWDAQNAFLVAGTFVAGVVMVLALVSSPAVMAHAAAMGVTRAG